MINPVRSRDREGNSRKCEQTESVGFTVPCYGLNEFFSTINVVCIARNPHQSCMTGLAVSNVHKLCPSASRSLA